MSSPLVSESGKVDWEYVAVQALHRHMAESSMMAETSREFELHKDPVELRRCLRKLRDEVVSSGDLLFRDGQAPDLASVRDQLECSFRSPTLEYGGPAVRVNRLVSDDGTVDWRKVGCSFCSVRLLCYLSCFVAGQAPHLLQTYGGVHLRARPGEQVRPAHGPTPPGDVSGQPERGARG